MGITGQSGLAESQQRRLGRFEAERCVDIHCHCLPALDDGPADMAAAVRLARELVADGVTHVVATPHQLGRFAPFCSGGRIRQAVQNLQMELDSQGIPLQVAPGAEIRIDPRAPEMIESGELLTLGDQRHYVLIELPLETWVDPSPLVARLKDIGIATVLAHPERYEVLAARPQAVAPWLHEGALLQVNAASITGQNGPVAERLAWTWLAFGWVSLVATDAHGAHGRYPGMSAAIDRLAARMGHALARRLCLENPDAVLAGRALTPPGRLGPGRHR
jgi:protein-tyrosine phosphatase